MSFFAKEEAIMLPVVLILVDAMVFDEKLISFRTAKVARYLPFFLLAVLYLWVRAQVLGAAGGLVSAFTIEPVRRLLTVPAVLLDYFLLLLFPFRMDYGPRTALVGSLFEPRILFPLLFLFATAATVPLLARRKRVELFGLLWFLIVFFPMSNVIPIYAETAHSRLFTPIHFLYVPSIGMFLCAAIGLEAIIRGLGSGGPRRRLRTAAILSFCLALFLFSLLSIKRNFTWKDELRFYQYVVSMHPGNHRMLVNLGNVYLERGQVDAAVDELERAVLYAPDKAAYRNSLALAYKAKGWFDKAAQQFREGLRLNPNSDMMYVNLAAMYRENGRIPEAIAFARKALELSPSSAAAHVNLALAYQDAGDLAEAEERFKMALRVDPGCSEAYHGLGMVYALQERYDLARREWENALRINPTMGETRENLQRLKRMGY
jgi:Tfp pilus assembly protein PilF